MSLTSTPALLCESLVLHWLRGDRVILLYNDDDQEAEGLSDRQQEPHAAYNNHDESIVSPKANDYGDEDLSDFSQRKPTYMEKYAGANA